MHESAVHMIIKGLQELEKSWCTWDRAVIFRHSDDTDKTVMEIPACAQDAYRSH